MSADAQNSNSDEPTPLQLDYARPLVWEERLAQAEAIIIGSGSLQEYQQLFTRGKDAAVFYRSFQTRRFARGTVDGICKGCGKATDRTAAIGWVEMFTAPGFRLDNESSQVRFQTYHSVCPDCLQVSRQLIHRQRYQIAYAVALALIGIGYLFWSGYNPPWALALKEKLGPLFFAPPITLVAIAGIFVQFRQKQVSEHLPKDLRRIGFGRVSGIRSVT